MPPVRRVTPLIFRTVGIRPQFGGIDRPVLASIEEESAQPGERPD
jgi:hypothetical protein